MKYYKNIIKIVALVLFSTSLYAQQEPNYSLYRYTMNVINPAYAGSDGYSSLAMNFRSQWSGLKDAPETQSFFFATPMGEKVGLGVSVVSDEVFIERNTSFNIDFSYKLQLSETQNLFFGLKAGGNTYDIDRSGLADLGFQEDPALGNIDTGFKPNVGLGAYLVHEKYFLSLSIPSLLLSSRINNDNGRITYANEKAHLYFSGGYNFDLSNNAEFRPSTMVRYVSGAPLSTDLTAAIRYLKKYEVGATYRTDSAWAAFFMFNLAEWIDLGYAYEGSTENVISNVNDGTHELFLRFNFGFNK